MGLEKESLILHALKKIVLIIFVCFAKNHDLFRDKMNGGWILIPEEIKFFKFWWISFFECPIWLDLTPLVDEVYWKWLLVQ